MAIISMGHEDSKGAETVGAYCPFDWKNDVAVHIGNSDIPAAKGGMFLYSSHAGLCIKEREANYYDDSDFYMLVWDVEAQAPYEIQFATTRGWSYPCFGSAVDATPEVLAEYRQYLERQRVTRIAKNRKVEALIAARKPDQPHKGSTVVVARGRKIKKGITGKIIGISEKRNDFTGDVESFAMLETASGFWSVLLKHLDLLAPSQDALQEAFDAA